MNRWADVESIQASETLASMCANTAYVRQMA